MVALLYEKNFPLDVEEEEDWALFEAELNVEYCSPLILLPSGSLLRNEGWGGWLEYALFADDDAN